MEQGKIRSVLPLFTTFFSFLFTNDQTNTWTPNRAIVYNSRSLTLVHTCLPVFDWIFTQKTGQFKECRGNFWSIDINLSHKEIYVSKSMNVDHELWSMFMNLIFQAWKLYFVDYTNQWTYSRHTGFLRKKRELSLCFFKSRNCNLTHFACLQAKI